MTTSGCPILTQIVVSSTDQLLVNTTATSAGTYVLLSCQNNYVLNSATSVIHCTGTAWSAPIGQCIKAVTGPTVVAPTTVAPALSPQELLIIGIIGVLAGILLIVLIGLCLCRRRNDSVTPQMETRETFPRPRPPPAPMSTTPSSYYDYGGGYDTPSPLTRTWSLPTFAYGASPPPQPVFFLDDTAALPQTSSSSRSRFPLFIDTTSVPGAQTSYGSYFY